MIQDPANRMSVATLKLKEARQGRDQSVRDFANFLDELKEDIPEISQEEQHAWLLLNELRAEVRSRDRSEPAKGDLMKRKEESTLKGYIEIRSCF